MPQFIASMLSICLTAIPGSKPWQNPSYEHRWGYVNSTGREVIAPKYVRAGKFNHGYAKCTGIHKQTGLPDWNTHIFVDKGGNEFRTEKLPNAIPFEKTISMQLGETTITQDSDFVVLSEHNGLKLVRTTYQWFVLDANGKSTQIPITKISPMGLNPKTGNWWLLKDKQAFEFTGTPGKCEIPGVEPAEPPDFVEEYIGVPSRLSDQYRYVGEYSEGLMPALTKDKHWQYLDKDYNVKITLPPDCCAVYPFSEGLAAVAVGGKPWEFTDTGGHSQISSFNGAKFGFVDTAGKFIIPPIFPCPEFEWTSRFKNGLALATAEKNGTTVLGYINKNGQFVVPPKYSKLDEFSEGLAAFDSCEPGFEPAKWSLKLDRYSGLIQFLRQYDVLSMKKEQIVKLLGRPDTVAKNPHAEQYMLSSGCGGSDWFAIRYDEDDKVCGYRQYSGGMIYPGTNNDPPSDWIVASQRPNVGEALSTFYTRAKKETYTPSFVQPVSDRYIKEIANSAFCCPIGQIPFDATVWQSYPEKRRTMLYSLFHRKELEKATVAECEKLLGPADSIEKIPAPFSQVKHSVRYYTLNLPQYDRADVSLRFADGRLTSLGFYVEDEEGIEEKHCTDWIIENPDPDAIASDINKYFALVGASTETAHKLGFREQEIAQLRKDQPQVLELVTTPDKNFIEKVRVNFEVLNIAKHGKYSPWETTKYFPETDLSPTWKFHMLEHNFIIPEMRFSEERWKRKEYRDSQLFDIVHCKNIIGSKRSEVQEFLGLPDIVQKNEKVVIHAEPNDKMTNDCDWYALRAGEDNNFFFEIAYKDDIAIGYRISIEQKEPQKHFERKLRI